MPWSCGKQHCPTHSSAEHQCPGWVLAPISDSVGSGGDNQREDVRTIQGALNRIANPEVTNPRFATDGVVTTAMVAAIQAFQQRALGAVKADGKVDRGGKTYRALARQLHLKRIVVSLKDQMLEALEDGRVIHRFPCVSGDSSHPTDPGTFKIFKKNKVHRSRAYDAQMNYAMFFTTDGKAIHQYHGPLGLTVVRAMKGVTDLIGSHGCVRLDEADARKMFEWTPMSTTVHVY